MLKRARACAGIRLTIGLPMSIEVNSRFDGPKFARALVERLVHQRAHQRDQPAHRIVGALRIGDVALLAGHHQRAVLRAAPADLDHVAERVGVGRLAEDAVVECFAALGRPLQELDGAVDRDAFLVAGDQERDRALRRPGGEMVERRRDRAGDARPSCRPRRGRRACRRRSRRRTAAATRRLRRRAAPRRCGRRTPDAARRCRCGRRGSRSARCRAPRR